jgi:glycosyltransferase involved in cell wall biosynthesis
MKVLHVIPSISETQGGPSFAVRAMTHALRKQGIQADIATTDDDGTGQRKPGLVYAEPTTVGDDPAVWFFPKQTEFYKFSWPMRQWLNQNISGYDLVHIHAVFSFATIAAGRAAKRAGVPYLIRPLGSLSHWGMSQRRPWLKKSSFALLDKPVLDRATRIHFTSEVEQREAAALHIQAPGVVLPLGFDLSDFLRLERSESQDANWAQWQGKKVLLFLSRLDEKKGLPILLDAFQQLATAFPEWQLAIAGQGNAEWVQQLKSHVSAPFSERIHWLGHVAGQEKLSLLARADAYVLPSYSENFGIALLEAMAAALPCVTTHGVALAHETHCAEAVLRIPPGDAGALMAALTELFQNPEKQKALAERARAAAFFFTEDAFGQRLVQLYESCLKP